MTTRTFPRHLSTPFALFLIVRFNVIRYHPVTMKHEFSLYRRFVTNWIFVLYNTLIFHVIAPLNKYILIISTYLYKVKR